MSSTTESVAAVAEPQAVQAEAKAESKETKKRRRIYEEAPVEKVPLLRIDNTVYENYRQLSSNEEIENLVDSIKSNGLKQNLVSGLQPDGRLGLACGFQRHEALLRLALEDVVEDYNKHFGYTPENEQYVFLSGMPRTFFGSKDFRANVREMQDNRAVIRKASPEWAKKFDEALAKFQVNVQIKNYKKTGEALIDNMEENELRSNPSLADKTRRIIAFLDSGTSATELARATGDSNATISHYKRIYSIIPFLQGLRKEAATLTGFKDEEGKPELTNFLRKMDGVIAELGRRFSLSEDDPARLQFQQLRELSHTIDPKNEAERPPLPVIVDIVAVLVRTEPDGSATANPTFDMSTFKARVKDILFIDKQRREAAAKAEQDAQQQAAGGTASTAAPNLGTPAKGQPEASVVDMLDPAAMGTKSTVPSVDSATAVDAAIVQANQPAAAPTAATTPGGVVAPTDAQRQAAIDQANLAAGGEAVAGTAMEEAPEISMSSLVPSVEDLKQEIGAPPTSPDDGQMRSKTAEANKSRYQTLPPDKVEQMADSSVKELTSELSLQTCSPYDNIQFMAQAKQMYYILGLSDKQHVVNAAMIGYVEKLRIWTENLETQLAKNAPADIVAAIKTLKPEVPKIELPA